MISKSELPAISAAITALVNQYGHPDEIPMGELAKHGVAPASAEICEMLLTEVTYPSDAGAAVAKWMRRIGEVAR